MVLCGLQHFVCAFGMFYCVLISVGTKDGPFSASRNILQQEKYFTARVHSKKGYKMA